MLHYCELHVNSLNVTLKSHVIQYKTNMWILDIVETICKILIFSSRVKYNISDQIMFIGNGNSESECITFLTVQ